MSKLSASGLATGIAIAMLVGMSVAEAPTPSATFTRAPLPVEMSIPAGRCVIQYDTLPETHRPAHMECEHADWRARDATDTGRPGRNRVLRGQKRFQRRACRFAAARGLLPRLDRRRERRDATRAKRLPHRAPRRRRTRRTRAVHAALSHRVKNAL